MALQPPLSDDDPRHGEQKLSGLTPGGSCRDYGKPLAPRATTTRNVDDTIHGRSTRREHRRILRDQLIVALVSAAGSDFVPASTNWVVGAAEAVSERAYPELT